MKYIIGNWKSNKKELEVNEWFDKFSQLVRQNKNINLTNLKIVILPPFVYLDQAKKLSEQYRLPLKIGAQDISPYPMGAYSGEVNSIQLTEYCEYVLIGHSERRKYFHEDSEQLAKKVFEAQKVMLKTIYCVPDANTEIPPQVTMAAYEPIWAIGSGNAESPDKVDETIRSIKEDRQIKTVIYGGSVTPDNIINYINKDNIDGVLPGGASLDPNIFWQLITHAAS